MAFDLEVEFSGLCLYLVHPDKKRVGVVMPDARKRTANPRHDDGTDGIFHVGYLRFDLASLDPSFPSGDLPDEPRFEVVHRFDRQTMDFGLPGGNITLDSASLEFPDFGRFAPTLEPIPGLFAKTPPKELLMRTVLTGGALEAAPEGSSWGFDNELNGNGKPYGGQFACFSKWKRPIKADHLTITLTPFAGGTPIKIQLHPRPTPNGDAIILKVANLCAENPLEWEDLDQRLVKGDDVDFKWLYRVLKPKGTTYHTILRGGQFPVPERRGRQTFGVIQDCMGGRITTKFTA